MPQDSSLDCKQTLGLYVRVRGLTLTVNMGRGKKKWHTPPVLKASTVQDVNDFENRSDLGSK